MAPLRSDIVIVNEFSVPQSNGSKTVKRSGSRGGTPGDYVLRYMARSGATESLAPIRRQRTDVFIERYMAREEAVEALDVDTPSRLKGRMRRAQGQGGVAFGYGQVSLSHDALKAASQDVQRLFDDGHTVMKTVLSFDQEYLRRNKLIPENLSVTRKGEYRGHLDQMKLRLAIMNGLDRMGRMLYDDLRYVAVIQVDTQNVHCHLAMVDAGNGRLAEDGTQRGKINDRAKSLIRRGIDTWLDEKKHVRHLSSAVGYERRNVATYVKRWAHQQMLRESLPQFLLACLPADRRQWRYSTNARAMRKPNSIVREIVEEALAQPGSPYPEAMARVQKYANHRRKTEDLDQDAWEKLVAHGRERIIERGVNGVYALLRALPADHLQIKTPMLDVMGLDYEQMAQRAGQRARRRGKDADEDLIGFGFRLRSYSSRLTHHTAQREQFHQRARAWEAARAVGAASPESRALYELFRVEEGYHARVAAKYRSLLNFMPRRAEWQAEVDEVTEYGERLLSLVSLRKDQSLRKMKDPHEAEALGRDIYGQPGGALVSIGDKDSLAELDRRIALMRSRRAKKVDELKTSLASKGLRLEADAEGTLSAAPGAEFVFEDVKALDLHHMSFDFARDVEVGARARERFSDWSRRRIDALQAALAYLEGSEQESAITELPVADVLAMGSLMQRFTGGQTTLVSEVSSLVNERKVVARSRTVRLGQKLQERVVEAAVEAAVDLGDDDVTITDDPERISG